MAWFSKYVQKRVSRISNLRIAGIKSLAAFRRPANHRISWLVGSSLLLVFAPLSVLVMHTQGNKATHSLDEIFSSADEISTQAIDLSVENTVGQYGQNASDPSNDYSEGSSNQSNADVSLQATINGQDASVTLNGDKTELNPTNDTFHKSVESDKGKTNIDINIKNGGASISGNGLDINTSSKIQIWSSSSSSDDFNDEDYGSDYYRHERNR